jgi:tRNA threonylcarbamoyladenosine biosynthesis protein TsaB
MIVLALDTALEACSVAVGNEDGLLARRYELCGKAHAERLMPMVEAALGEASLSMSAIARIGVTVGPGSFTGLRTGLAAARGFALALSCPAIGITTCAALAAGVTKGTPLVIAIDARRGEIYLAAYDGKGRETLSPRALSIADAAALLSKHSRTWRVAGSAADALTSALAAARLEASAVVNAMWPDAANMLALVARAEPSEHPPRPLYLRAVDAKRVHETAP